MSTRIFDLMVTLQTALDSVPGHPFIQFDNMRNYTPVNNTRYWRTTLLPNRNTGATLAGAQQMTGFYQVDIIAPSNIGINSIFTDSQAIFDYFNDNRIIQVDDYHVKIQTVSIGEVLREGAWSRGFVEIEYKLYTNED